MTIIWCMVPEIYWVLQIEFFVILVHFLPFYPPNNPKNQNFIKMKKYSGNIIILHKCTINDNHMMYGSWVMKGDRQNFLSFWTAFCPFTILTIWKLKIFKNSKKGLEISSFYIFHDHMLYCSLDMARNRFLLFFILG